MDSDAAFREQVNNEWDERLKENVRKISDSALFVGMMNGVFDDPLMCMQFGVALFMDKPIYLVVNKNTKVPENVRKVAAGIEYVDYDNMDEMSAAIKRIMEKQAKGGEEHGAI